MAPLQSYTTAFYRQAHACTFGHMDKYFTPFFEDKSGIESLLHEPELSRQLNEGLNCIPQVATNQAKYLIDFAREVQKAGFDEININMGCPFPMLTMRQRGGGILQHPELVKTMLEAFFSENISIKLSVKMRMGTQSIHEGETIVKLLNQFPLEELIIHPRLVSQKYTGQPDWGAFSHLQQLSKHTIIANGDINTSTDAHRLIKQFPDIKGLMLGRGLLSQPQLPALIKGDIPLPPTIFDLHEHYFRSVCNFYPDWQRCFNLLMVFWYYPLQANQALKRAYRKLKKHNKPDSYQIWLNALIQLSLTESLPPDKI